MKAADAKRDRPFPIMHGKSIASIPWAMIEPHERQAFINHDQSLARLAERGGLDAAEAVDVLLDRPWTGPFPKSKAESEAMLAKGEAQLADLLRVWGSGAEPVKLGVEG